MNVPFAQKLQSQQDQSGFTIVEVLIAGIIMASILMSVARFSAAALAGSSNQRDRQALEAAINNNIQLLQQADSQITKSRLEDGFFNAATHNSACKDPSQFLIDQIGANGELTVNQPVVLATNTDYDLKREEYILNVGNQNSPIIVVKVIYSFQAPEQSIGLETREVEMNASFESSCYE
jgi:Tfp pilus assembly protein PilV